MPDFNVAVICGTLATTPEMRVCADGTSSARYLVTTRSEGPSHRVDVVPVVHPNPGPAATRYRRGDRLWIAASVQRRFGGDEHRSRSGIEVVAHEVVRSEESGRLEAPDRDATGMVDGGTPV